MLIFACMDQKLIYFDHAASTPIDLQVLDVMQDVAKDVFGNPSSVHEAGRRARVVIENARRSIARNLQVTPAEVFFTSGGTEANNAILWGCARDLGYRHFITSPLEHPAVLNPLETIREQHNIRIHLVKVDASGHVDLDHLAGLLQQHPDAVVSLMHANNETGTLLPVKAVSKLCHDHGALFHSDTVQTIGKFGVNLRDPNIDFAVASAHKFHGPKGVGFMVIRAGNFFKPFVLGGGQERNMRAGTENLYGIVGMAEALNLAHEGMEKDQRHILALKKTCMTMLKEKLPGVAFNGDAEGSSLHTILNLTLPAVIDPDMLLPRLDMEGICVSSGSACASGTTKGSHVLEALGVDMQRPSLRISFSRYNTPEEVQQLVDVLVKVSG